MIRIITIADPHLGETNDGTANLTTAANYLRDNNSKFDLVTVLGDYHDLTSAQTILNVIGKPIRFAKGNHDGLTACSTSSFGDNVETFNGYQLIFIGACGSNPGQPILTKTYNTALPTIVFVHYPSVCIDSWDPYYKTGCGFVDTLGLTNLLAVYSGHVHIYTNQVINSVLYITEDNLGGNGPASDYIGFTCIQNNTKTYTRLDYKTGTTIPDCVSGGCSAPNIDMVM